MNGRGSSLPGIKTVPGGALLIAQRKSKKPSGETQDPPSKVPSGPGRADGVSTRPEVPQVEGIGLFVSMLFRPRELKFLLFEVLIDIPDFEPLAAR